MAVPITRMNGGGYFTDFDPWGRTIASNLPPTQILHLELERLGNRVRTLEDEKVAVLKELEKEKKLNDWNMDCYKEKIFQLKAQNRKEVPATASAHTSLYQTIDTAISTADANILRAILREVCRESEKAAKITATLLSPPTSANESNAPKVPSTTGTTSTRRTSVRFHEPMKPDTSTPHPPYHNRRASARLPQAASSEYSAEHEHIRKKKRETTSGTERRAESSNAEFTTPRRTKRRADEDEAEELGSRKRRSTAPLTCTNCNKEYQELENARGACRKHSGHKEVCDEWWEDWDEEVHGPCEAYIKDPEYVKGFVWSCCGEDSDVRRCTASEHSSA